jgi:uncharacterized coiled-coil protein SlyX
MSKKSTKKIVKDELGNVRKIIETPVVNTTVDHSKDAPQHRPTKRELEKAAEEKAQRDMARRETINVIGRVKEDLHKTQSDCFSDMFFLGLKKNLGDVKLEAEISELESKQRANVAFVAKDEKMIKFQQKMIAQVQENMEKLHKKLYKKAKKKFGKKAAKIMFCNASTHFINDANSVWSSHELPVGKKLKKKYAQRLEISRAADAELVEVSKNMPHVAPEDLSLSDQSNIYGKEKTKLPVDAIISSENTEIPELEVNSIDRLGNDTVDLLDLARKMP